MTGLLNPTGSHLRKSSLWRAMLGWMAVLPEHIDWGFNVAFRFRMQSPPLIAKT